MSVAATVVSLLTPFLGDLAKGVVSRLTEDRRGESKLKSALEATKEGVSIVQALKGEFGEQFAHAISNSMHRNSKRLWSHEAGVREYVQLDLSNRSANEAVIILRDEININLDRLVLLADSQSDDEIKNYFRGAFGKWRNHYREVFGVTEEDESVFHAADLLLGGEARNFKDVFEILMRTSLGLVGAGMVIIGVLTTLGIGVGAIKVLGMWLFGIPWATVGALVVPGAILVALSRYKFRDKHAMTTCVSLAYKLLEQRSKNLTQVTI